MEGKAILAELTTVLKSLPRGLFIVFEGLDRCGKSTQVAKLVAGLQEAQNSVKKQDFPDRSTPIGQIIDKVLKKEQPMAGEALTLLFAANRWEVDAEIRKSLKAGTSVVSDRFAYSGVAYALARNPEKSVEELKNPDRGLSSPDIVFMLKAGVEVTSKRGEFGNELFERQDLQKRVGESFEKIQEANWVSIDATKSIDEIHQEILKQIIAKAQQGVQAEPTLLWK